MDFSYISLQAKLLQIWFNRLIAQYFFIYISYLDQFRLCKNKNLQNGILLYSNQLQAYSHNLMRQKRGKQYDWSKPFKLVATKKEFDQIETADDLVINLQFRQKQNKDKQSSLLKKQQIVTPKIQTVKRVTEVKSFAKITPNYIRLLPNLNLPKVNDYELTEVDNVFVKSHKDKYKLNGKNVLTEQLLKRVIIYLEKKAGKDPVIPRNKGWMTNFIEKQYKQITKMSNYEAFSQSLYNYWKNRRQQLKFPLFRPLWRPNADQFNHLLAFKFRQKDKRNLRRNARTSQDDILQQLCDQFQMALKVSQRVQTRQSNKWKQTQISLQMFHNQIKSVFPVPQFVQQINTQGRPKDRQKLKKFSTQFQGIKKQRQIKNQQVLQAPLTVFDQKESVCNFLASVIAQAQVSGLNYDRLFHYKGQAPLPSLPLFSHIKEASMMEIPHQPVKMEEQQYLNFSLKKAGDYLIRSFQQEESESYQQLSQVNQKRQFTINLPAEDILDFKRKKVCAYYFGSDDQGDYQNLKKNIVTSFKKFQQLKGNTE